MTKNQFRMLICLAVILGMFSGIYDLYWPSTEVDKVFEYITEVEPEIKYSSLVVITIIGGLTILSSLVAFLGLMLFKSWARHVYITSYAIFLCLYPFIGVTVYNGFSQVLYDSSTLLSGICIALMYYSPVAKYFEVQI